MKNKRMKGIEQLNRKYGRIFVLPWVIGMLLFYIIPLVQSFLFSVSEVSVYSGGIKLDFIGFSRYKSLILTDPDYTALVKEALLSFLYSLPVIILLSMVLALLLNQKFRGRLVFRSLYFLPVIISTGVVINLLFSTTSSDLSNIGVSESYSSNMFDVEDIIEWLGLTGGIAEYISLIISKVFDLIWKCGIQTVLFIAGLQSVDRSLYEAGAMDGIKSRWHELWYIPLPAMKPQLLFGAVLSISSSFSVSTVCNTLCGFPSTDYAAHTIVAHLEDYGTIRFDMGYACAIATLLFLLMIGTNKLVNILLRRVGD